MQVTDYASTSKKGLTMDRFYVRAGFKNEKMMFVGVYDKIDDAIRYSDNIGEQFSQGIKPQEVLVEMFNNEETVKVTTTWYNGYYTKLETMGV